MNLNSQSVPDHPKKKKNKPLCKFKRGYIWGKKEKKEKKEEEEEIVA